MDMLVTPSLPTMEAASLLCFFVHICIIAANGSNKRSINKEEAASWFKKMDTNKDLYITKAELQEESSKITWDCIKIEIVSYEHE